MTDIYLKGTTGMTFAAAVRNEADKDRDDVVIDLGTSNSDKTTAPHIVVFTKPDGKEITKPGTLLAGEPDEIAYIVPDKDTDFLDKVGAWHYRIGWTRDGKMRQPYDSKIFWVV